MGLLRILPLALLAACPGSGPGPGPSDLSAGEGGGDSQLAFPDGARSEAGRDARAADSRPLPKYAALNHVLCTGQSLSVGAVGSPALSTAQPFANKMFNTGVLAGGTNLTSLVPLVEASVETMSSGFANLVTQLAQDEVLKGLPSPENTHALLVSCHGVGGQPYSALCKGTTPYANGMAQLKAALAITGNKSYLVRAVTVVHGESDHSKGNTHYAADLAQWQADYQTDVQALTSSTDPIPLLQTQISSWTRYNSATSTIPQQQLQASIASGGKILLCGPKYFLPYSDGVHLTNKGYRWMGEYYAKVYRRVVLERGVWEPVRPKKVTRTGAVVTIQLFVPAPPLVLDTVLVSNPGSYGFEFADGTTAPPTIASVVVSAPDTVTITLSKVPAGTARFIRYAWRGVVGNNAGPTTGPRGNLRDSDATPSRNGNLLYNWCVHFSEAVP